MDEGISSRAQSPAGPLNPAQMGDLAVASSSHTHWNVGRGTQKVPAQHWWMGLGLGAPCLPAKPLSMGLLVGNNLQIGDG